MMKTIHWRYGLYNPDDIRISSLPVLFLCIRIIFLCISGDIRGPQFAYDRSTILGNLIHIQYSDEAASRKVDVKYLLRSASMRFSLLLEPSLEHYRKDPLSDWVHECDCLWHQSSIRKTTCYSVLNKKALSDL